MARKSRPMGYIFPKRIKDAMQGGPPAKTTYYYSPAKTEEEIAEKNKEIESRNNKHDILAEAREAYNAPNFCPVCNKNLKNIDKKFWRKRGVCLDCVARVETHLKLIGKYQEYSDQVSLRNYKAYILDIREQATEFVLNLKDEIKVVNHDGSFDTLKGDQQKVRDFINAEIEDLNKKLEEIEDVDMSKSAFEILGIDVKELAKDLYEKQKDIKERNVHNESITQ